MEESEEFSRRRRSRELVGTLHLGGVFILLLCFCSCMQIEWIRGVGARGLGRNFEPHQNSDWSSQAEDFVKLLTRRRVGTIRLHDANADLLRALGEESSIKVIVGLRNDEIADVGGTSVVSAERWVARNVLPFLPRTKIIAVAVGNDALTSGNTAGNEQLGSFVVPAMRNIHLALSSVGLEKLIKVSAPLSLMVLSSYAPTSSAAFQSALASTVMPALLTFLRSSGSFLILNLNPVRQNGDGGERKTESFVKSVTSQGATGVYNLRNGLPSKSVVNNFVDAFHVALASLNHGELDIVVAETGLPTASSFSVDVIGDVIKAPKAVGPPIGPSGGVHVLTNGKSSMKNKPAAFSARRLMRTLGLESAFEIFGRRKLADKSWCVADPNADTLQLQNALDWACGPGKADCAAIQSGGSCFLPNNVVSHASYAFNSYYQEQSWAPGSCDFSGTAHTTTSDPSTPSCLYSSKTSSNGSPSTPTGTIIPSNNNFSPRLVLDRRLCIVTTLLFFLLNRTLIQHWF